MGKTLYLHIGMPKCASSTIQDSLNRNADKLRSVGKLFGFAPGDRTTGQGNATQMVLDLHAGKTVRSAEAVKFFAAQDMDVVLSSEFLIGLARHAHAEKMLDQFVAQGFSPKVICYLRRQDEWIESDFKQHVKGGSNWTDDIEALITKRADTRVLDYHWMLNNWARSIDRADITAVPLCPGQGSAYALERFYAFLGLPDFLPEAVGQLVHNVSPSTDLIEAARYLKQALIDQGLPQERVAQKVVEFLEDRPDMGNPSPSRALLSWERRAALLAQYKASNEQLTADYLGGTPPFLELHPEGGFAVPQVTAEDSARFLASCLVAEMHDTSYEMAKDQVRIGAKKWFGRWSGRF